MLIGWALIVVAVVALGRVFSDGRRPAADRALAILRERYACGEIDRAEFEARSQDLRA